MRGIVRVILEKQMSRYAIRSSDYMPTRDTMKPRTQNRNSTMPTSIRLSPETEDRLASIVEKTGRTKSFYIREMIERSIDDVEDYYLAADIAERVHNGQEQVFTADEVRRDLGLDR